MSREERPGESRLGGRPPVGRGGLVAWEGIVCRAVRRRRVSAAAFPRVSEFELYLEPTEGTVSVGWVPEHEVQPATGDAAGGPP